MDYIDLEKKLKEPFTYSNESDEQLYIRLKNKYAAVPLHDSQLFIFNTDREFENKNHIISLHQRNSGKVPMHIFHYIVITYVYYGELTIILENETITLSEGDIIIFDKHVPHSVLNTSENDLGINIILSERYFSKRFINHLPNDQLISQFMIELMNNHNTHSHYLLFHTNKDHLIHTCIQNILCEHFEPAICSDEIIDNFIMIFITHLIRKFKYNTNLSVKMFKNQNLMDNILHYISTHYKDGNLKVMCQYFGYEVSYTSKLIKKFSGKTFKQLVNDERMKEAIKLLHNNDIPIYEIAQQVGITNLTYFYKKFQEFTDSTPQQYRSNHK